MHRFRFHLDIETPKHQKARQTGLPPTTMQTHELLPGPTRTYYTSRTINSSVSPLSASPDSEVEVEVPVAETQMQTQKSGEAKKGREDREEEKSTKGKGKGKGKAKGSKVSSGVMETA